MRGGRNGGYCKPDVYIDGFRVEGGGIDLDVLVQPANLVGYEVYRSAADAPAHTRRRRAPSAASFSCGRSRNGRLRAAIIRHMTDLVLLHGALGAGRQLDPLAERLTEEGRRVHVVELEGHGSTPARGRVFAIEHFAENVVEAMDARGIERAAIFGYSMGGYVALHLAATRPERVERVVTLGTKFRWDPETAEREARRLDPAGIRDKIPRFADTLAARHASAGGWEGVLVRTASLLRALGAQPVLDDAVLGSLAQPVRVMVGDRDVTVTIEETAGAYRALGSGEMVVMPRTPHPFEQVDLGRLAGLIVE